MLPAEHSGTIEHVNSVVNHVQSLLALGSRYFNSTLSHDYVLFQSFYAQKRVNLKQIAIVSLMVVLVSTIYVHNQKKKSTEIHVVEHCHFRR